MRATRLPLALAATLGLLAGLTLTVVAQDEEPAPVTFVTGTVVEQWMHDDASAADESSPHPDVRGYEVIEDGSLGLIEQSVEWSDPRLPSQHWFTARYQMIYDLDTEKGALTTTSNHLLEDEDGSWRGSGRFVKADAGEHQYGFYMLEGEGAYEGLYALLRGTAEVLAHGPYELSYEGHIFEAEPLSQPGTPVPVTSEGMLNYSAELWPE